MFVKKTGRSVREGQERRPTVSLTVNRKCFKKENKKYKSNIIFLNLKS